MYMYLPMYPPVKINFHSFRTLYLIGQRELGLAVVGDRTPVPSDLVHHISTQAQLPLIHNKKNKKHFLWFQKWILNSEKMGKI